jgi:hypothetical protein
MSIFGSLSKSSLTGHIPRAVPLLKATQNKLQQTDLIKIYLLYGEPCVKTGNIPGWPVLIAIVRIRTIVYSLRTTSGNL